MSRPRIKRIAHAHSRTGTRYQLKTGSIWSRTARVRAQVVRRVCESLEKNYGKPRLGNPANPLDDLVYIIISNKTSPEMAASTYEKIKDRFPKWEDVLESHPSVLRSLLSQAGLSKVKSEQIRATLRKIKKDFRTCSLDSVRKRSEPEIEDYLVSLPGVSGKVAKCVMMYTLNSDVLPVDAHAHRIATRLGWTARKRADQCHDELEALIPPRRRYAFHVGCVKHGRLVCRPKRPLCDQCSISSHCEYWKNLR